MIGYSLISIIGICVVVGLAGVLALIGATFGSLILGAFIVLMVAVAIREYFEGSH